MNLQEFRKLKKDLKALPTMEKEAKQVALIKQKVGKAKAAVKTAEADLRAVPED